MSINRLGRYQIIREIARSNDIVYEAVDTSINRRVALKELLLPPNLVGAQKQERIDRFYREARAAGSLSHPNIVTIFEAGEDHGRHFIAMEYLEGQTLRDVLNAESTLSIEKAIEIATQVLDGLSYAHSKGIVHRDIKPDNVQILPGNHVKITDFGIARIMEEPTLTADGQVFGTPSYMSPEQVAGKNLDCRSDLFSVGIVLFEMLTGRKPFTGDSVVTITYNIMNQDVSIPPSLPPYLGRVISRSLAKDPNLRYGSAAEMTAALDPNNFQGMQSGYLPDPFNTTISAPGPMYGPDPASQPPTPWQQQVPPSRPDPFASIKPGDLSLPKLPDKPLISAEAKYFLMVMFTVVLVCGLFIGLIWGISVAYQRQLQMANTQSIDAYFQAGKTYYDQQSYQAAAQKFDQALKMATDPETKAKARDNIALCYVAIGDDAFRNGNTNQAAQWWQSAMQVDSKNPAARERMAILYLERGNEAFKNGDLTNAVNYWQQSMDAAPGSNAGMHAAENLRQYGGG